VRDLVWTIIFIWLAYKIYEMVKGVSNSKKTFSKEGEVNVKHTSTQQNNTDKFKDAEYVDYEEIK